MWQKLNVLHDFCPEAFLGIIIHKLWGVLKTNSTIFVMNTRQENGFHGNSKLISYYLEMYCGTHSMNSNYMKVMQQENKR